MSRLVEPRAVLAVRDLAVSTRYYTDVLGFRLEPIDAPGWSFLVRDSIKLMLGECRDEVPAAQTGNHSWFVRITVEELDDLHREVSDSGADVITVPGDRPYGQREFVVRTSDGHRIMFAEPLAWIEQRRTPNT